MPTKNLRDHLLVDRHKHTYGHFDSINLLNQDICFEPPTFLMDVSKPREKFTTLARFLVVQHDVNNLLNYAASGFVSAYTDNVLFNMPWFVVWESEKFCISLDYPLSTPTIPTIPTILCFKCVDSLEYMANRESLANDDEQFVEIF
jgi:hypothetical protein